MFRNLPAPFLFITSGFNVIGILESEDELVLSSAVLVAKKADQKWRNTEHWISAVIKSPSEGLVELSPIGNVDMTQTECMVIRCERTWEVALKRANGQTTTEVERLDITNIKDFKKTVPSS